MVVGEVDGQMVIVALRKVAGAWTPYSIVRVETAGSLVSQIIDYGHCPWVLHATSSVTLETS
jgi:hypothetical protein